jgi:LysR family glycine cleavage system transcriptional activator
MRAAFPPLACLLAFEAVARRSSFTLAAGELHLTASAISHQVSKLEEFLEVRLFERTARNVELTDAGNEYLRHVAGALNAIGAATDNARKGVRNSLHIHSTPSFATLWLMPRLADFARTYPGISLSMSSSVTHSDFTLGQVDIDIRYGLPNWPHLIVQPIFDEQILPLAAPGFLDKHTIDAPEDLLGVPLIQSTVSVVQWPDWFARRGVPNIPASFAYRFDRAFMALDAAVQGLGVALESTSIGEPHLRKGMLRPVFQQPWFLPVQAHFLVYPHRHAQRPEVVSFVKWLREKANSPASRVAPTDPP